MRQKKRNNKNENINNDLQEYNTCHYETQLLIIL